jgi:DNA-binding NtrC family response regulator
MTEKSMLHVLALVPHEMQNAMQNLHQSVTGSVTECATADEFGRKSCERTFEVVLIPAGNLSPHEWWNLWGELSSMEPRPSILVYTDNSSFQLWAGVLSSGGFDVIIAPYTIRKLRNAIESAAADFARRTADIEATT